jgi:hypothetical protein
MGGTIAGVIDGSDVLEGIPRADRKLLMFSTRPK